MPSAKKCQRLPMPQLPLEVSAPFLVPDDVSASYPLLFFFSVLFIYLRYNIVLVLPYIDMNPPWVYMCSPS